LQHEFSAYIQASFFTSIDSLLFSLASNKGNGSTTSRLMQASLTGALVFHAATGSKSQCVSLFPTLTPSPIFSAILAYVASFILVRYRLNDAQSTLGSPKSAITSVYAKYAAPGQSSVNQQGKLSALESGPHVGVEHGHNFHTLLSSPVTSLFSTLSTMFTSLLDQPPLLNIDIRRVSFLDLSAIIPCVGESVDTDADAEKNAISLVRLLDRCHHVCAIFALVGFLLVVTGIVAYVWAVLEHSVAIFGSVCVGFCIICGLAALL
jgi:hypothetical protein